MASFFVLVEVRVAECLLRAFRVVVLEEALRFAAGLVLCAFIRAFS